MVDQFATLILNSCSLDHLNQGWSQLNTCVRWELHAQAFYVTGHHCKNRNSGHSICEPQSPPPSTYFLVMITECVCYQDKVSPRFHIPGIHASPCKTIHILGGGGRTQDNKQEAHSPNHCLQMIYPSSFYYLLPLFNGTTASIPMNHRCCVQLIENVLTTQSLFLILILCSEIVTVNSLFVFPT